MIFGMNLLLWTTKVEEAHYPALEALAAMGYDAVEIPIFDVSDVDAYAALGRRVADLGLARYAVSALGAHQNVASPDAAVRAAGVADMKRMMDAAAALGAPFLSGPMHSALGVFSGAGPTEAERAWSADALTEVAAHGARQGVRLGIEPLNRFECYMMNDLAAGAAMARRVGHGSAVLYDTFHSHIEEKDPAAAIRAHGEMIGVVHVSENDRSTPGAGQVRFADTFRALKAVGYQGPLVVEAFGLALPELSAATRIWRRMFPDELTLARDALAFMKREWAAA
jgi:D-psicose/D-tagatose/L-ribulose 3-epimerase